MAEVNLMARYPRTQGRQAERPVITDEDRRIARRFGAEYFDGPRRCGYGGYQYHPRFWTDTVAFMREYYRLPDTASVLDVGCAKGFMLSDFHRLMPQATLAGIDVSEYAIANAVEEARPFVRIGDARKLPFPDSSFDLVLAINIIHNLSYEDCKQALREVQRVSRRHAFIMVDAYRTEDERQAMLSWVLTAETMLPVDGWLRLFAEAGYSGDYYWWIVE
jgi:ubiquinone/menaquinone biosynthesis C-methylase UbiE